MKDITYFLYMADEENRFPQTREESIQKAIALFQTIAAIGENPNEYIDTVLKECNLKEVFLSDAEITRINGCLNSIH